MPQLSRPFQIVLVVFVLFAALWFAVLRGHSASSESSSPSSSAATTSAGAKQTTPSSANAGSPASKGSVYHGSAPGVEGLSRAIQKARGAVAQSQQNANQLQQKSAQASSQTQGSQTQNSQAQGSQQTQSRLTHSKTSSAHSTATKAKSSPSATTEAHPKAASGIPAMQATVEGELHQGKVVAVLFFNPDGSVDNVVRRELQRAGHSSHGKLAVHVASAKQVGAFGSFTRTVQVYSTPTILLINKVGVTSSLTGLTDAFSIEQAVREVKAAK
ncbi:MAG TPA: hypothetical protein VGF47_07980 [Solirubrobacteraceae bacterium]|jgi:hypothetical protein